MAKAKEDEEVVVRDLTKDEMPVRTPDPADYDDDPSIETDTPGSIMGEEAFNDLQSDLRSNPVDLTVDAEPDHAKTIPYDPIIHERTKPPNVQLDPATWDDLRALNTPPPVPTAGYKTYVCIQHPTMIVFGPDGHTILGRFENGYLITDNPVLIKVLESPSQRYVKRLDRRI